MASASYSSIAPHTPDCTARLFELNLLSEHFVWANLHQARHPQKPGEENRAHSRVMECCWKKNPPGVHSEGNVVKQNSQDDNKCTQTGEEGDLEGGENGFGFKCEWKEKRN